MTPFAARLMRIAHRRVGALLATVLLAIVAYLPGVGGPFVLDDEENITSLPALALEQLDTRALLDAAFANDEGIWGRPLASLTFALNHYFAGGFETSFFKATNVAIHFINAWLVYGLAAVLLATPALATARHHRHFIAALAALLWAAHPLQLTGVLYVVQRMTSLAALFTLAGLLIYVHGRNQVEAGKPGASWTMFGGALLATLLGPTAKETALLFPLYALAIELVLFRSSLLRAVSRRRAVVVIGTAFVLCAAIVASYLSFNPNLIANSYGTRSFDLQMRLLSEARVMWHYAAWLLLPYPSSLGLFHDDILPSNGWTDPPTTLIAVLALIAVLLYALHPQARFPVLRFAVLWFLAGHALEGTLLGLELAFEHRNYVPSFGPLFAASIGLARLGYRLPRPLGLAVPVVVVLTLAFVTWSRAHSWADLSTLAETTVRHHPDSPRANHFMARVRLRDGDLASAIRYTLAGLKLRPSEPGFHIDLQTLLALLGNELHAAFEAELGAESPAARRLRLPGLTEELDLVREAGEWRLRHASSTFGGLEVLLRTQPITAHTLLSLDTLRRCLLTVPTPCASLADAALRWHEIALSNPGIVPTYAGIVAASAAALFADRGDYAQAYGHMVRAARAHPRALGYRLRVIEYLALLGRSDEAQRELDALAAERWPQAETDRYRQQIEALRDELGRSAAPS